MLPLVLASCHDLCRPRLAFTQRALCVVAPSDDLHDAIIRMVTLDAHVMVVANVGGGAALTSADVVGVVTRGDIARNLAAKSHLLSRDRTLEAD